MILVLAEDYPSENNEYALAYIHTRNLYYKEMGIEIKVLNFRIKESYVYEGITVISKKDYKKTMRKTDIELVISHAPNLKNHIIFIKKNLSVIQNVLMIFHGHEVLRISDYYPKAYSFSQQKKSRKLIRDMYDSIKLPIMNMVIKNLINENKLSLIFVSEWMRKHFAINVKLEKELLLKSSFIIPNSAHPIFLEKNYDPSLVKKEADFITIRPLDNSKYGIDLVCELAIKHPELSFHVYGKGEYFKHYSKPPNLKVIGSYFTQTELPELLDKYRAALMPTRLDAQGVMVCEMATYGIPVVTSDIPICTEMLKGFENTFYVNNETLDINLEKVLSEVETLNQNNVHFSNENTVRKEVDLIRKIMEANE